MCRLIKLYTLNLHSFLYNNYTSIKLLWKLKLKLKKEGKPSQTCLDILFSCTIPLRVPTAILRLKHPGFPSSILPWWCGQIIQIIQYLCDFFSVSNIQISCQHKPSSFYAVSNRPWRYHFYKADVPMSPVFLLAFLQLFFFLKFYLFIYLFVCLFIYLILAVLGLRFCARAFSSCGKWGPLFIAVRGPLTVAASLVAEHRLQSRRLSNCGSRT